MRNAESEQITRDLELVYEHDARLNRSEIRDIFISVFGQRYSEEKILGKKVDVVKYNNKKIDSDIATFTNQVGLNGFHEYANVDYASEINFANSDNTVVCSVPRMANSDYTVSCASVKWYDAENKQVIEAIASALPKPDKITYYKTSKDDIIDSPVSGYQRMIASTVDGMAMFYRASGGSWFYFKTVQGLPVCDDFKTDVLKKAFYGMECRQLGNGVTTKVGI